MTTSLLHDLQDETCPVTLGDIHTISTHLSKSYSQLNEVNLENSTFGQMVSNTLLTVKRAFVMGSYEPESITKMTFDPNVLNWLQFRERLIDSPVILQTDLVGLLTLLSNLHRDVFSGLESNLSTLNKNLSTLLNKPEELKSISGNRYVVIPAKNVVDLNGLNKVKGAIKDQPVSIKIGRIYNSISDIRKVAGSLNALNYDYARVELKNILTLHNRTVELLQTLVSDSNGVASGTTAKNLVDTMISIAITLETLGVTITLLDKLTILVNNTVESANEAHDITLSDATA